MSNQSPVDSGASRQDLFSGSQSDHDVRVEGQRARLIKFAAKSMDVRTYLENQTNQVIQQSSTMDKLAMRYKLSQNTEEHFLCTTVSQSNIAGFSHFQKATFLADNASCVVLGHVINLNQVVGASSAFRLNQSFVISKFFSSRKEYFLTIHDIYCVNFKTVYIFHERFTPESSLLHRVFNSDNTVPLVNKQIIIKLAEAVEYLNIHGVAHRFIRPENVLVIIKDNEVAVKLTSFDMACLYWDPVDECSLASPTKGLPIAMSPNLLEHLPPEAFKDEYDCSMVDVWGVATLMCFLLAGENPFHIDQDQIGIKLTQWNYFGPKLLIADELRSLLDDIFVHADARMTIGDLVTDKRLDPNMDSKTFIRMKHIPYYRIDLNKNINPNKPASICNSSGTLSTVTMAPDDFSPACNEVCEYTGFRSVTSEEDIGDFQFLRDMSFDDDLSSITNDYYLKVAKAETDFEEAVSTDKHQLVKIVQQSCVPLRHMHQILGESSRIMRYLSDTEPYNRYIHRVLQIFYVGQSHLYLFYENLHKHQSIHQIISDQLDSGQLASTRGTSIPQQLTLDNIQKWVYQLFQTVSCLAKLGLSHRYVRPEYVFITPDDGDVKLSHFDLACFMWNSTKSMLVPRRKAIQDELPHQWNHLPPECYDPQYHARLVDVWSVAVLVVFCFTGQTPFEVPLSESASQRQWRIFKDSDKAQDCLMKFPKLVAILDDIFVPIEQRLTADKLVDKFKANKRLFGEVEPSRRHSTTTTTAPQVGKTKSAEALTHARRSTSTSASTSSTANNLQRNVSSQKVVKTSSNQNHKTGRNKHLNRKSFTKTNVKIKPHKTKPLTKTGKGNGQK